MLLPLNALLPPTPVVAAATAPDRWSGVLVVDVTYSLRRTFLTVRRCCHAPLTCCSSNNLCYRWRGEAAAGRAGGASGRLPRLLPRRRCAAGEGWGRLGRAVCDAWRSCIFQQVCFRAGQVLTPAAPAGAFSRRTHSASTCAPHPAPPEPPQPVLLCHTQGQAMSLRAACAVHKQLPPTLLCHTRAWLCPAPWETFTLMRWASALSPF